MQTFIIDFIPVLLFLFAFKMYGIYAATIVGIVATAIQVVVTRVVRHKFDNQQLVTLAVFVVFGSMTLYFHNPIFLKWKPTIIFWIFGLALLVSHFFTSKPIIQRMMEGVLKEQAVSVPSQLWKRLNLAWMIFFLSLGLINIYVAYTFSTEIWVNFKVFGIMSLVLIFGFVQAMCLAKHLSE